MSEIVNIYCDESGHLPDDNSAMALGAIVVTQTQPFWHNQNIREIKKRYGMSPFLELKWTKVSPAKIDAYREIINYFFAQPSLSFRAIVIPDKRKLRHEKFQQTHDEWYYKMYFQLLTGIIVPDKKNRIYLDIKDTLGKRKTQKLHTVLCNDQHDFERRIIEKVQTVRSHEIELMSIADIIIGALTYFHRNLNSSSAKLGLLELIKGKTKLSLQQSTPRTAQKFNLFIWQPQEV